MHTPAKLRSNVCLFSLLLVALIPPLSVACGSDFNPEGTGGAGGTGGTGGTGGAGGTAGAGGTGATDGGTPEACQPGVIRECYSGPKATNGIGACKPGKEVCGVDGTWGACDGEVTPTDEDCSKPGDEDCNGQVDDGCVCNAGETESCYGGPDGTEGVGMCAAGTRTCAADGKSFGPCTGEVLPTTEDCAAPGDEDCDGIACSELVWAKLAGDAKGQWGTWTATDSAGNLFVAGNFEGTLDFGGSPLSGGKIFVAKLSPQGAVVWAKSFTNTDSLTLSDLAVDGAGNPVIVGTFYPTFQIAGTTLTADLAQSHAEAFVLKLDPGGTPLWARDIDGTSSYPPYVAADASGNITVLSGHYNVSSYGMIIRRYSADGQVAWSKYHGGPNVTFDRLDLAVDGAGNAVIVGKFWNAAYFATTTLTSAGSSDAFAYKISPGGGISWALRFGGVASDAATAVAVTAAGEVFVAGKFTGSAEFQGVSLSSVSPEDAFLLKLGDDGVVEWRKQFGIASAPTPVAAATDSAGNIILAGPSGGSVDFGGGIVKGPTFLAKLSSAGTHLWSKGLQAGALQSVATDATQHVYIAGDTTGPVDFGGGALTPAGASDVWIAKFAP
jgi:hypothetical protein